MKILVKVGKYVGYVIMAVGGLYSYVLGVSHFAADAAEDIENTREAVRRRRALKAERKADEDFE